MMYIFSTLQSATIFAVFAKIVDRVEIIPQSPFFTGTTNGSLCHDVFMTAYCTNHYLFGLVVVNGGLRVVR